MSPSEQELQDAVKLAEIAKDVKHILEEQNDIKQDISELYKRTEATKLQLAKFGVGGVVVGAIPYPLLQMLFGGG